MLSYIMLLNKSAETTKEPLTETQTQKSILKAFYEASYTEFLQKEGWLQGEALSCKVECDSVTIQNVENNQAY